MKTLEKNTRFVEWLSAEEMHEGSKEWLSELEFIKDEHLFFEDLIKTYTFQLIRPNRFLKNKKIIEEIGNSQKINNQLIKIVKMHESKLHIMLDGIDQPKQEEDYKAEHRSLIIEIRDFLKQYRALKSELFASLKQIKKEEKIKSLID